MILWMCARKMLICLRRPLKCLRMKYDVWVEVGARSRGYGQNKTDLKNN